MRIDKLGQRIDADIRGKVGRGGGFGRLCFGYNTFGLYSIYFGIFSKKYYFGKPYISKMKFYRPTNPQTIRQQNWRVIHAYGTFLWQNKDTEQQEPYKLRAYRLKMTGYNLWLSRWLKQPTGGFGQIMFGYNGFGFTKSYVL